jgi:hypothetical protein
VKRLGFYNVGGAARFAAAVVVLSACAGAGRAQVGPPPGAGAPPAPNPRAAMDQQIRREAALRGAEMRPRPAELNPQQLAAAIEQTKNDFKRIQILRNEIVERLLAKKPLDYRQLASQAEEINKRAGHLKSFLMKPAAEPMQKGEGKKPEAPAAEYDEEAMKAALIKLCNTIYSFTDNPMFKNLDVVDAKEPARAGGELLTIIELSENVKRNAERMARAQK